MLASAVFLVANPLANSRAAIGNSTPHMKLASMFITKKPAALPNRNPMPMMPFAMNSHFMERSVFAIKVADAQSRDMPMKP